MSQATETRRIPADGDEPVRRFQNHPIRWRIAIGAIGFVLLAAAPLSAATSRVDSTADTIRFGDGDVRMVVDAAVAWDAAA